jgi:Spy/CpxP family protein refolding chaperone
MACLTTAEKQQLRDDIADLNEQIAAINAALKDSAGIESYKLDTGEGSQSTKYRSMKDMLDAKERLVAERNRLQNILRGTGLANMRLRRY